jgi:hypothetical protein
MKAPPPILRVIVRASRVRPAQRNHSLARLEGFIRFDYLLVNKLFTRATDLRHPE